MANKLVSITGGVVVSSLGEGKTAAALGRHLKRRGYSVSVCKLAPYLNVNPGTMNPYQHGEVFVTDDGAETDLDVGHYERFIDEELTRANNTTSGQIFLKVLDRDRRGGYHGGTVQMLPYITDDEIKAYILGAAVSSRPDVLIVEVGGAVEDIERQPFLKAIRQIKWGEGAGNCAFVHVTLAPYINAAGELKSKPTLAQREGAAFHRYTAAYHRLQKRKAYQAGALNKISAVSQFAEGLRNPESQWALAL